MLLKDGGSSNRSTSVGMHLGFFDLGMGVGLAHFEESLAVDCVLFHEIRELSFTNPSRARGRVVSTSLMPASMRAFFAVSLSVALVVRVGPAHKALKVYSAKSLFKLGRGRQETSSNFWRF